MTAPSSPLFVALDLETTGLAAEIDRIVEIGAVKFDEAGREHGRFSQLVHPGRPMPARAQAVHGIGDRDLIGAPDVAAVLPDFFAWLGDPATVSLMAHNASFDAGFLGRECVRIGRVLPPFTVIDTLTLARSQLPKAPDHRLDTLCRILNIDLSSPHRALSDALRVKELWLILNGRQTTATSPVAYSLFDPNTSPPIPEGWDVLIRAARIGQTVRIEYSGGTRGALPRDITPRRFAHHGGVAYIVALCHQDQLEKSFRLDRVKACQIVESPSRG